MSSQNIYLSGQEKFFDEDQIIVSKTDLKGRITYANRVFLEVSGYELDEIMGQPHNIIRHPDMPRCVFKLLWDTLATEKEIFAYVINRSKDGRFYWVFAHVTPSYDINHILTGYHSNRRVPKKETVKNVIIPLYKKLIEEENAHSDRKTGMAASTQILLDLLHDKGIGYDQLVLSI